MEDRKKSSAEILQEIEESNTEAMAEIRVAAAQSGSEGYTLKLYEPIMVGSEKRDELHFRAQTLRDIREGKTDDALTAALCGLTSEGILQLSSIDYASTQEVLAGFHLRRAGGGLRRKA